MHDITEHEESLIPLPKGWVRALSSGTDELIYRNTVTGLEVMDHPYIIAATNAARKMNLPDGWGAKVVTLDDGSEDTFYRNERAGVSIWDHPLLRQCLASVLIDEGQGDFAETVLGDLLSPEGKQASVSGIMSTKAADAEDMQKSYDEFRKAEKKERETKNTIGKKKGNYLNKDGQQDDGLSRSFLGSRVDEMENKGLDVAESMSPRSTDGAGSQSPTVSKEGKVSFGDNFSSPESTGASLSAGVNDTTENDDVTSRDGESQSGRESAASASAAESVGFKTLVSSRYDGAPIRESLAEGFSQQGQGAASSNYLGNHAEMWNQYRRETSQDTQYVEEKTRRVDGVMPPESVAGVHVLTEDVKLATERVHELLVQLRVNLTGADGMDCRVMQNDETVVVRVNGIQDMSQMQSDGKGGSMQMAPGGAKKTVKDLVVLGADIMSELRDHPEYIISAMALCDPLAAGMSQIAFTALHRMLHPMSCDPSLSTLFLLQCINFQIEEVIAIGHLFPELDKKKLASRALYISDPKTALNWNPLAQPLPVVPATQSETVLACSLRTYAVRRDVSVFFRCAWRPIIRSVHDVTRSSTVDGSRTWNNLVLTACRIIECTFNEAVICSFPPTATAVARSLFQIGGNDALHYYLFNFMILPNILRVLGGDHSGIENERTVRLDGIAEFSTRYYNIDSWWPLEGIEKSPYNPATTLVWALWKFYMGAALINQADIEILSSEEFFRGHPQALSTAGVKDKKLRIMLLRCQRRIDHGCQCLLRMPLDMHGSSLLNIDPESALNDLAQLCDTIPRKSMEKRMASIVLKPRELVGLTVMGRHEIANIFSDVGVALEARGAKAASDPGGSKRLTAENAAMAKVYADGEVPEGLTAPEASLFLAVSEYLLVNDAFGEEVGEEFLIVPFQYKSENENIDTLLTMIEANQATKDDESEGGVDLGYYLDGFTEEKSDQQSAVTDSMNRALDDAVRQRYSQLVVGLELAGRYETTLLEALHCLEEPHSLFKNLIIPPPLDIDVEDKIMDTQNSLARLLEGSQAWYYQVELEVDFARDEAEALFEKHTKASTGWTKEPLNGLEPVRHLKVHPSALPGANHYAHEDLFEDILDLKLDDGDEKGHQTWTQKASDFVNSFRFNSAQRHVAANSSLMDKHSNTQSHRSLAASKVRHLAHKNRSKGKTVVGLKEVRGMNDTNLHESFVIRQEAALVNKAGRARYTKPVVDEKKSNFLKPTKSHISKVDAIKTGPEQIADDRKTPHQLGVDYLQSLRGGKDDAPTPSSRKKPDPSVNYSAYDGRPTLVDAPSISENHAQPFPEHLRHRIRGSKAGSTSSSVGTGSTTLLAGTAAATGAALLAGGDGEQLGEAAIAARMAARRDMQELLADYHEEFTSGSPSQRQEYDQPYEDGNNDEEADTEEEDERSYHFGDSEPGSETTEQQQQQSDKMRFSNFTNSEDGSARGSGGRGSASTHQSGASGTAGERRASAIFELFEEVEDEELPDELPQDMEVDNDLRTAWRHMTADEKRKSAHYLFPKGDASRARYLGKGKGKGKLPAPVHTIKNTKFFSGTESKAAYINAGKSRRSLYVVDAATGAIPGTRDYDNRKGYNPETGERLVKKASKPVWRPAGVGGMDKTYARMRTLQNRPRDPLKVPPEYRGVPRGSFWGTHPHLGRSRMDKLFPAGAPTVIPFSPATDRAHYAKLKGEHPSQQKDQEPGPWDEFDQDNQFSEEEEEEYEYDYGDGGQDEDDENDRRSEYSDSTHASHEQHKPFEDEEDFDNHHQQQQDATPQPATREPPQPYRSPTQQARKSAGAAAGSSYNPSPTRSPNRTQYQRGQYNQHASTEYNIQKTYLSPQERMAQLKTEKQAERKRQHEALEARRNAPPAGLPNSPHTARTRRTSLGPMGQQPPAAAAARGAEGRKSVSFQGVPGAPSGSGKASKAYPPTPGPSGGRKTHKAFFSEPDQEESKDERGQEDGEAQGGDDTQQQQQQQQQQEEEDRKEEEEKEDEQPQPQPETPKQKSYYDEDGDDGKYDYSPTNSPAPPVIPRTGKVVRDASALEQSMLDGVLMIKHGRRGNPKYKTLKLNAEKTKIEWEEVQGKRSFRSSVLSIVGTEPERKYLMIENITEVRKGVQTEVLLAANNVDPYVSLSVITAERSLDMTFDTHGERDLVLRALKVILAHRTEVRFF